MRFARGLDTAEHMRPRKIALGLPDFTETASHQIACKKAFALMRPERETAGK
jgi:hypothetical protein